jgi:hypothetical protein
MVKNVGLSAAEASVLLSLPRYDARQALKLGFMGLLAHGILRIEQEEQPGFFRARHIAHLRTVANPPGNLPPLAASLLRIAQAAAPEGLMTDVVKQAASEYGNGFTGFVRDLVVPALVARGLAEQREVRVLGLFPVTRFYRTLAGDAERARLHDLLVEARAIPQHLDSDPARAAALVAALGGAILLVDGLRPHYAALERALRPSDDSGGGDGGGGGGWDGTGSDGNQSNENHSDEGHFSGPLDFGSVDFGSIDFGAIDFSAFDAGAFDSFDAGFSDAGGDGGGGDGGGDGGSSGC